MTIYKPRPAEGKTDQQKSPLKSKVVVDDSKLLAAKPKPLTVPPATVRVVEARRRRSAILLSCFVLIVIIIIAVTIIGGIFLYQRLAKKAHHQYVEEAQFKYFEYQKSSRLPTAERRRINHGSFMENIEIDEEYTHERLDVPPILGSSQSTIVHDFEKNLTAIVDRERRRCYVMPLNRTAVQPPRSFLDLLVKYKSGYYLPDAEVIRDNYKVQLPAVTNLDPFGVYIWLDCRNYNTYRLVHDDDVSRGVTKRSACEVAGDVYCLGGAGASQMMCLKLTSCTASLEPSA